MVLEEGKAVVSAPLPVPEKKMLDFRTGILWLGIIAVPVTLVYLLVRKGKAKSWS